MLTKETHHVSLIVEFIAPGGQLGRAGSDRS